ncbi:hypothetical protein HMPREF0494_0098 [Limosilactobacillus antri DSM 16041]|uniref:Uncharacterized protein n=1 Tax=Limosilactobacillus antri DSM 16041 TaxID=525309 RepID=C8P454_9LACO|nr:hypothetical protein HMPREF0494_0098 [Limosilactobacillus antri DSM 16041]
MKLQERSSLVIWLITYVTKYIATQEKSKHNFACLLIFFK